MYENWKETLQLRVNKGSSISLSLGEIDDEVNLTVREAGRMTLSDTVRSAWRQEFIIGESDIHMRVVLNNSYGQTFKCRIKLTDETANKVLVERFPNGWDPSPWFKNFTGEYWLLPIK